MSYPWAPGMRRSVRYSPAIEFARGATGLWLAGGDPARRYGPERIAGSYTRFQGLTPLNSIGQSAGMVLGLDQGAELGPQLAENGDFATEDTTDWYIGSGLTVVSVNDGEATVEFAGSGNGSHTTWFSNGEDIRGTGEVRYYTEFDAAHISGGDMFVGSSYGSSTTNGVAITSTENGGERKRYRIVHGRYSTAAGADKNSIVFSGAVGAVWSISNVVHRRILGNHATQATNANEPTLAYDSDISKYYWSPDGADWWEADGSVGTLTGDFEIHAAVRRGASARTVISKRDTNYNTDTSVRGWALNVGSDDSVTFSCRPTNGGSAVTLTGELAGTDIVVGIRRVSDTLTLSVDGQDIDTASESSALGDFSANLQIFRDYTGSGGYGSYFAGRLYGAVIYNQSLTDVSRRQNVRYLARLQGRTL